MNFGAFGDVKLPSLPHAEDSYDDLDRDESISERLIGLTEMFPEVVRSSVAGVVTGAYHSGKWLFNAAKISLWVISTSAVILALPVVFENEKSQAEESHLQQQRQMLLGPNVAVAGHHGSLPHMPVISPPGSA